MAEENRIVFPDEVDAAKAKAAEKEVEEKMVESNEIPQSAEVPSIQPRNMITAPSNCPAGQQMGADGVCRDVF